MPNQREKPFITVIWLTKLLVGENSCEWATWFKAHYQRRPDEKVPSAFDFTAWRINHTALLNKIRDDYEEEGFTVTTEMQNTFYLNGQAATLSGTPDLIAMKGASGVIIDAKVGKPSASHLVQVQLYMWAAPRALQQHHGVTFSGVVAYQETETAISSTALNKTFVANLTNLIKRVSANEPARKVPSIMECKFCDVTHLDCPERAAGGERVEGETEEF